MHLYNKTKKRVGDRAGRGPSGGPSEPAELAKGESRSGRERRAREAGERRACERFGVSQNASVFGGAKAACANHAI